MLLYTLLLTQNFLCSFPGITSASVQKQQQLQHNLLTVKHKNDIVLKCITNGAEPLTIEWFKNAEKLQQQMPNINYMIDERNRKLIIIKPTKLNNGVYQCSANNDAGIVFSQNNYVINIDLKKNKNQLKYRCSYKSANDLSSDEMKSNNNDGDDDLTFVSESADDRMEIMKNVRRTDQGLYLCRGKRGGDKTTQELTAAAETIANDLSSSAPTILGNLIKPLTVKLLLNENDAVTLNCDIGKGNKKNIFIVKWKKDDKLFRHIDINSPTTSPLDVNTDSALPREDCKCFFFPTFLHSIFLLNFCFFFFVGIAARITTNRRNGSLIFSSILTNDVGLYECQTFNEQDIPISVRLTDLKVIEQLKFVPPPTSKNLELGTMGKMHCKVQGTPTPQIKWIKVIIYFYLFNNTIKQL